MKRAAILWLFVLAACAHSAPGPLRVLVFNIHAGKDAKGVDNLQRVADLILGERADIVLLQEVDRRTQRSGGVDQLDVLMKRTGLHGAFGKSLDYEGGEYGIAVLSRWPINARRVIPLRTNPPQPRAGGSIEPRVALFVETHGVAVLNTHLDASRDETYRLQEIADLLPHSRNTLMGGDFNAEPVSEAYSRVVATGHRDAWTSCGSGDGLTYPATSPVKRIDYLFLPPAFTCRNAVVLDSHASDHRALLVTLERGRAGFGVR